MLTVENVTYKAGKHTLVKDISFMVHPGEVMVILGANGAGKSSLMRLLSAEKKPSVGSITLSGKVLNSYTAKELALKRAILNQQNIINLDFLAMDIVQMGRYPHYSNKPAAHDLDIITEVMAITGTTHMADRSFLWLSGGEQQRVHLARVLAQIWDTPEALLLLDEPVSGMDILYQQQTLSLAAMLAKKGFMVVAILHDINLAAQYADNIMMLKNGRKWYHGSPAEILNTKSIYDVFEAEADVFTNPNTLKQLIMPKVMIHQAQTTV
ncbi:iron complex transport system ATP-binding protein [Mucilaginibacter gossypiicola]|uniref:Iron complex transport system ATP-binding protein n=1 Tax=Mucilaginibacter gossypiicola TaxID=551995 RepID=A0A1H8UJL5_9SPHI|nr:heme ABC transporter ATP-binding protein [Mucilaginibacter gossypiicola]SEP03371.1 iron complex transport system ATP-binding protein [Mucilaginibacter gossypiicola]